MNSTPTNNFPNSQEKAKEVIRQKALSDLKAFIRLVHPNRVLGQVHEEVIEWWNRQDAKSHQLLLLPRDHQKSALVAYRVAWEITKNPAIRVLYISSTSGLATKQLKFIKDILTSRNYRRFWPDMVNEKDSDREKWTESEISVDHPKRKEQVIRDSTVFTAGLTTNIVGLHCDIAVLDDVVVDDSADTEEGRDKVRNQISYLASIAGTDSKVWAVGTRYHPKDLYSDMMAMTYEIYNKNGEIIETVPLYETLQRQVESMGDGTGEFLWPRSQTLDGRWFGFDQHQLSVKRAQYADQGKFRAQYYNNPNDASTASIDSSLFQYYDKKQLSQNNGYWYIGANRINVFAAVDFAYSLARKADFTCILVLGCDKNFNYYVLDIDRFKTAKISDYFDRILRLHTKWGFRKIRAEVTAAQSVIVKDLKDNYIKAHGLALSIDEFRPTRHQGSKEERMEAILQPRYANLQMWHYKGGNCELLEEELVLQKPPHDDLKDCLASCIETCVPPSSSATISRSKDTSTSHYHPRFGGIITLATISLPTLLYFIQNNSFS